MVHSGATRHIHQLPDKIFGKKIGLGFQDQVAGPFVRPVLPRSDLLPGVKFGRKNRERRPSPDRRSDVFRRLGGSHLLSRDQAYAGLTTCRVQHVQIDQEEKLQGKLCF